MVCIVASQKGGPGFESNSHLMPCGSPCSCSLYMGTLQVLELPPAVQRYASYINQDGQHDFELDKERKKMGMYGMYLSRWLQASFQNQLPPLCFLTRLRCGAKLLLNSNEFQRYQICQSEREKKPWKIISIWLNCVLMKTVGFNTSLWLNILYCSSNKEPGQALIEYISQTMRSKMITPTRYVIGNKEENHKLW